MSSTPRRIAAPSALLGAALLVVAGCSSNDHPPVATTIGANDAGLDTPPPDPAVCNDAGAIDSADLPVIGSCSGSLSYGLNACLEWHAAGPFDYSWGARSDCAKVRGWTWSDAPCVRTAPGGVCAIPYAGTASACPVTKWDYYYAKNGGGESELAAQEQGCVTSWGGDWTQF